jgi:hypothetical protein
MQTSQLIARLTGPVFAVIGVGILTNRATYREIPGQFLAGYPFFYFSGILALVSGLAILNAHHVWTRDWRSVITAFGWVLSLVGVYRIVAPEFVTFVDTAALAHDNFFTGAGIVLLGRGGFLEFKCCAA